MLINYGGNCEEAFRFYEKHLSGKITMMMKHSEQPGAGNVPPGWEGKVLYARMSIGETEIMASDVPDKFEPMRSVYLCLTATSTEEAERIHAVLSEGGQTYMSIQETFFAYRFAMLRDRFGTSWMIIHERPMPNRG
jgi:PhnB protein